MNNMLPIKASVFMLTYNQEQFISQAIESVLMQETNFRFQLVIGEDGSTDSTLSICKAYQSKYPDKIKINAQPVNIGLISNFISTYNYLSGNYIAICDGDDYWIDSNKLQKQVNVLEANNNVSIVYSGTKRLFPDGVIKSVAIKENQEQDKNFSKLIEGNFIPSVTALFRKQNLPTMLPSWFETLPYGDWPLYLYALADGSKIHFINQEMAVYRISIGESHKLRKNMVNTFLTEKRILNHILKDPVFEQWKINIQDSILITDFKLMASYNRQHHFYKGFSLFLKLLCKHKSVFQIFKNYIYSLYITLKKCLP